MASHRLSVLLLALGLIGAAAPRRSTDVEKFQLKEGTLHEVEIPLGEIYSLLGPGPEPTVCLQMEATTPIEVMIGGCFNFTSLGHLGSEMVPLNQSFIENALGYEEPDYCTNNALEIRFRTRNVPINGTYSFFKCSCTRTNIPHRRPGYVFWSDTRCEPTKETWEDRSKEIRFYHDEGRVQREEIKMDHTIQAAIVDFHQTMCFNYKGDGLVKLTLSKCQNSLNMTIVLNSDMTYSFSNKQKDILKKIHHESCKDNLENWWLDIETFGKDPIHGHLHIFGCQRYLKKGETDDAGKPFKDVLPSTGTTIDGINIYFDLKENSTGVYSADIKDFLDQASVVENQGIAMGVNITSTGPVTVILTKCKNNSANGIVIFENVEEEYLTLNFTALQKYKELSVRPTCEPTDDSDAIYLHIITTNSSGTGSVCFSLDEVLDDQKPFSTQSFPKVAFAMANSSVIVRKISISLLFNTAFQSNKKMFFSLRTNVPVSIFVSKCRYGSREMIGGEPSIGEHLMANIVVNRITRATWYRCDAREDIGHDEVYLHFESHLGPVHGTFGFFSIEKTYQSNPMVTPFLSLIPESKAIHTNRPFEIATKDGEGFAFEVDINVFVEEAYYNVNKNLRISINRKTPVSISFSKCGHPQERTLIFNITGGVHILNRQEELNLLGNVKRQQCQNIARDGLLMKISEPRVEDVVTIDLVDFRDAIPNNGGAYKASEKEPHTVQIPLAPMDHGIAIRVTNVHSKPVDLLLTMCPSLPEAELVISNSTMTTAYIKLDLGHLYELKERAENCTTPINDILHFTIRSKHAKGLLTIHRPEDEKCDKWDCMVGAVKFFNNTANWIIA